VPGGVPFLPHCAGAGSAFFRPLSGGRVGGKCSERRPPRGGEKIRDAAVMLTGGVSGSLRDPFGRPLHRRPF
jgi:hypothetical protein